MQSVTAHVRCRGDRGRAGQGRLGASILAALALWPLPAGAADIVMPVQSVVAVLGFAALVVVGVLLLAWRDRALADRGRRYAAALSGIVATLRCQAQGAGFAYWVRDAQGGQTLFNTLDSIFGDDAARDDDDDGGTPPEIAPLLGHLAAGDRQAVMAAVEGLHETGTAFSLEIQIPAEDRWYRFTGCRASRDEAPLADIITLQDISDLSRQMTALANGLEKIMGERNEVRHLIDILPIAIWWRDDRQDLIRCNRRYAEAIGADPETIIAEGLDLGGAAIDNEGKALAARALALGRRQAESHYVVVGDQRRLLEFNEMPAKEGGTIGYAVDFTQLEEVQTQLSAHIASHGEVLENLPVAISIYGPDKRLRFYNNAFAGLSGLDRKWLEQGPVYDEVLVAQRERKRLPEVADFAAFKKAQLKMFTSVIHRQEELYHLPSGDTLRVVIAPHPMGGLMFIYEDVTDRLALETSYNTSLAVQRATLDNLYEAIAVFGGDGRLKLFNAAYARLWFFDPRDLEGEPHISRVIDNCRGLLSESGDWETVRNTHITRVTDPKPETGRLERGDRLIIDFAVVPLPDGNVLLSYLDVTDSSRVERALRERNEALMTADRLKSEFIANVSYELRTPLNTIIGFSEILANQYFDPLTARQLEYCRGIVKSSQQLMALINDILDLSTIEAGYMVLEKTDTDIAAMLSDVLTLTRERARELDLNLDFDCPNDIGIMECDERRLKQALFNLMSNAMKFTPAGGAVSLSARREDGFVFLQVKDTGIGIPEEEQERVFEKFERVTAAQAQAAQVASGAGLGLSLVRRLTELHGGEVSIQSAPGAGTLVVLKIPQSASADLLGSMAG